MKNCIYMLTSPSGKVYIGQAKDYEARKKQHIQLSKKQSTLIGRAIAKYGFESFKEDILYTQKEYNRKDLNEKETYYIELYNSLNKEVGYNICKGGEGRTGLLSDETKKKMSLAKKGKPSNRKNTLTSEKTRKQMSESHKKPASDYQKQRIAEGLSIPIEQYSLSGDLLRRWKSTKEARQTTGVTSIGDVLHGRQKTAGGFIWKYEDKNYKPSYSRRKVV